MIRARGVATMTNKSLATLLAATAATLALAACHDSSTGPKGPLGAYGLVSVNGQPLPARVPTGGRSQFYELAGGSVQLGTNGGAVIGVTARDTTLASGFYKTVSALGSYALASDTLVLHYQSWVTLAAYADTGTLRGDTIRIRLHLAASDSSVVTPALVFAR